VHDRFLRGFVAGVCGGIVMNLGSLAFYLSGLTSLPFWEWAAIMILGKQPAGTIDLALAVSSHLFFTGILGILFTYLILLFSPAYLLFKGVVYALAVWFLIYGITMLYKVQGTVPVNYSTVLGNITGATLYGLTLSALLLFFERRRARQQ